MGVPLSANEDALPYFSPERSKRLFEIKSNDRKVQLCTDV